MTRHSRFVLVLLSVWAADSIAPSFNWQQLARAQDPGRSSQSDSQRSEDRRDRDRRRGYFGDRGDRGSSDRGSSDRGRDYRGYRSRDEVRRSEERSSSESGSTSSSNTSGSSRSGSLSTTTTPPAATTTPTTQSPTSGLNMKEYAVKLVKQYDKNNDMMLQPEERKDLRGPAADSDLNHDGTITIDELVEHLSNPSATTTTPATTGATSTASSTPTNTTANPSGDRDRGGYRRHNGDSNGSDPAKSDVDKALAGRVFTGTVGGSLASAKEGDKRRTYRFTKPADRLPTNLPSWFKSRDTNGDGQVSMSEYSRSWSSSTVSEFRRYDLNDDGIITAKEAAKKP